MSVRVMRWVWDHSQSEGVDRLVLLAIADCADDTGNNAYPGITELMRKTRLSRAGVYKAINRLIQLGELERAEASGGRHRTVWRVVTRQAQPSTTETVQPSTPETVPTPPTVHTVDGSERPNRPPRRRFRAAQPSTTETVPSGPTVHTVDGSTADTSYREIERDTSGGRSHSPGEGECEGERVATAHAVAVRAALRADADATSTPTTITPAEREARRLCELLQAGIHAWSGRQVTITKRWLDAARLLLTRDGVPPAEAERVIRWATSHEFWRPNILSMPKLREKYLTLVGQMQRANPPTRATRRSHEIHATVQAMAAWASQQQQEEDEHDPAGMGHDHRLPRRSLPAPAHPT